MFFLLYLKQIKLLVAWIVFQMGFRFRTCYVDGISYLHYLIIVIIFLFIQYIMYISILYCMNFKICIN